jgi:hypothetical protein
MSISNLFVPNNLNLFCGVMTCNTIDATNIVISGISTPGQLNLTGGTNVVISATSGDIEFNTNSLLRLRIPNGGIPTDNTITNILGVLGSTLTFKNNLLDTTTAQTLTNKTIDSASNTIDVNGTNINTLINQSLLTTANVTFGALNLNIGATTCLTKVPLTGTVPASSAVNIIAIAIPNNISAVVSVTLSANCLTGAATGYSDLMYDFKTVNNGGTLISSAGNNSAKSEANIIGAYTGKLNLTSSNSGNSLILTLTSTLTTGSINYGGNVDIFLT